MRPSLSFIMSDNETLKLFLFVDCVICFMEK